MLRFSTPKVVAILAAILFGFLVAMPNLLTADQRASMRASVPSWVPSWLVPTQAVTLGLDLQGGSHVLLEVDVNDLIRSQTTGLRDDVRRILRETRASLQGGIQIVNRGVQLRVPDAEDRARLMPRLRELSQPITNPVLGQTGVRNLDLTEAPDGLIQVVFTQEGVTDRVRRAAFRVRRRHFARFAKVMA